MIKGLITVIALYIGIILTVILLNTSISGAGIGPNGFAPYARQGIINENCKIYNGCSNSPWNVTCTDTPNYTSMSDVVTCKIVHK